MLRLHLLQWRGSNRHDYPGFQDDAPPTSGAVSSPRPMMDAMKIEWFLSDLDESVRLYHTLRRQLRELPAESRSYSELELREQVAALRQVTETTLEAIKDEPDA